MASAILFQVPNDWILLDKQVNLAQALGYTRGNTTLLQSILTQGDGMHSNTSTGISIHILYDYTY